VYDHFMPTQAERREATMRAIEKAAQHLFETRGFADTTVDDIVSRAGVAKGAFYHHYESKEIVFTNVLEMIQAGLAREVAAVSVKAHTPVDMLRLGLGAYVEACHRPRVRQVLLLDGPSVLGWPRWREIDDKYFGKMTQRTVAAALGPSAAPLHVSAVAALISGAFAEAAMLSASGSASTFTPNDLRAAMDVLLTGLEPRANVEPVTRRRKGAPASGGY
jgi:AcrR family transcriptional regulator